jgi:hypothetical protein
MKINIRPHGPDVWGISNTEIKQRLEYHSKLIDDLIKRIEKLEMMK